MDKLAQHGRLARGDGRALAYVRSLALGFAAGRPGVVYMGGFRSDMTGAKALHAETIARSLGIAFIRFDYSGHGESTGTFEEGSIGVWARDAIDILDHLTTGPQILIGSSMGGWLMLLVALARPERIAGLIGVASAPDFTERLIWNELNEADQRELISAGTLIVPSAYSPTPTVLTRHLIEEGRRHLLLGAPIGIRCPVRLLHGMADPDVPHLLSLELAERLETSDCRVTLVKDGEHRLSRDQDLALLAGAIQELVAR